MPTKRYVGKEKDEETGLYYIGARYYAHWLARWMADDPINNEYYNISHGHAERSHERVAMEFTASGYEYCYDNPVRFVDPTGEQAIPPPYDPSLKFSKLLMSNFDYASAMASFMTAPNSSL